MAMSLSPSSESDNTSWETWEIGWEEFPDFLENMMNPDGGNVWSRNPHHRRHRQNSFNDSEGDDDDEWQEIIYNNIIQERNMHFIEVRGIRIGLYYYLPPHFKKLQTPLQFIASLEVDDVTIISYSNETKECLCFEEMSLSVKTYNQLFESLKFHFGTCRKPSNEKIEDLDCSEKVKFRPQQLAVLENSHVECSICYELLFAPVALNCSHTFCQHCIGEWRKTKNTCPLCRVLIERGNRVLALDQIIEKVEGEMIKQDKEFKAKREDQKKKHAIERQVGDAEPSVARNFTRIENIEFEVQNGHLSSFRIPFHQAPLDIYPEDIEFDRIRDAFNFAYYPWQ